MWPVMIGLGIAFILSGCSSDKGKPASSPELPPNDDDPGPLFENEKDDSSKYKVAEGVKLYWDRLIQNGVSPSYVDRGQRIFTSSKDPNYGKLVGEGDMKIRPFEVYSAIHDLKAKPLSPQVRTIIQTLNVENAGSIEELYEEVMGNRVERHVVGLALLNHPYQFGSRIREAQKIFQGELKENPAKPDAYRLLGQCELRGHRQIDALKYFLGASLLGDQKAINEIEVLLGKINSRQFERAIALLRESTHRHTKTPVGFNLLGKAQQIAGRPNQAAKSWRRALQLDPKDYRLRRSLGDQLFDEGKFGLAQVHYRRVVAENPEDSMVRYRLAEILEHHSGQDFRRQAKALRKEAVEIMVEDRDDGAPEEPTPLDLNFEAIREERDRKRKAILDRAGELLISEPSEDFSDE